MSAALVMVAALLGAPDAGASLALTWEPLADGVERTSLVLQAKPEFGDGRLHVVRIDPERAELRFALASERGGGPRPASAWAAQEKFVVAINAGMYATDHRTNVGLLVNGAHRNNPGWHPKYQSALGFAPRKEGIPRAVFVDLDAPDAKKTLSDYGAVVQNLRLLKGGAQNVWARNDRRWSEAAVAQDAQGRILFLFSRSPMTMFEFNERLKALPLQLTRAMHVEGGPEASLSIRAGKAPADLCGSYETLFRLDDGNERQWPIPNVLGVVAR